MDTAVTLSVHDVTAFSGEDYTVPSNVTLTISAGSTSGTAALSLPVLDDSIHEGPEEVAVRGSNADPGLPVTGVRVTINDNDTEPTAIVLSLDKDRIPEGAGLQDLTVKATLSGGGTRKSETSITLTTSNDTTTDSDYSSLPATLSIAAGWVAGTATLTVAPVDDSIDEDDETLKLMAATAVPGFQTPQHVIITITDDDEAGVTVTPNELTVLEGRSESYTVVLKTQPSSDVTVTVSGHADTDVNLDKTTLTFTSENWDTAQTVKVTAAEDDDAADDDDVTLAHAVTSTDSLYDGATATSVTVSITEKDIAGVTVNPRL